MVRVMYVVWILCCIRCVLCGMVYVCMDVCCMYNGWWVLCACRVIYVRYVGCV